MPKALYECSFEYNTNGICSIFFYKGFRVIPLFKNRLTSLKAFIYYFEIANGIIWMADNNDLSAKRWKSSKPISHFRLKKWFSKHLQRSLLFKKVFSITFKKNMLWMYRSKIDIKIPLYVHYMLFHRTDTEYQTTLHKCTIINHSHLKKKPGNILWVLLQEDNNLEYWSSNKINIIHFLVKIYC